MSLTGRPLILLAAFTAVVIGAATVRFWSRGGRFRALSRTAGVLLLEASLVITAGLAVNRHEEFYPSWQALRGDTGTETVTDRVHAGLLDVHARDGSFTWRPPGLRAWNLARPPTVTLPADYHDRTDVTFPVMLEFATQGAASHRTGEEVTVTLSPTATTSATALLSLPAELARDLRVSTVGWSVEGGPLAAAFVAAAPPGTAALDRPANTLPPALAAPLTLPAS
ncbi:hypothetical protein JIG36_48040 [Actinoplanes sp. LDG1-06]|uniref:Uncharacterized protein n=1 Tax=Paractinoplanes ovalisporus TaxID=2810368 RepID=A0ABS2AU64_9ACTN|nr:hypothetical protein [Actinoplanes ovalisporus]MBM2623275.1 hypothetical protein [Actinoplanes ovalisporus]